MSLKLEYERTISDLANLEALYNNRAADDPFASIAYNSKKEDLENKLRSLEREPTTLASLALIFNGAPVSGSYSIDASFASELLSSFQKMVTCQWASLRELALNRKGPIPNKSLSHLKLTGIARGSFGFLLEEPDSSSPQLVNSPLKEATIAVTALIDGFSNEDEEEYIKALESMDARIFSPMRKFIKTIHHSGASLKLIDSYKEHYLSGDRLQRAFERIEAALYKEEEVSMRGVIFGITPMRREFEMRLLDSSEVITGKFEENISQDFLERIERDELALGHVWSVKVRVNEVRKPDGSVTTSYTMFELKDEK